MAAFRALNVKVGVGDRDRVEEAENLEYRGSETLDVPHLAEETSEKHKRSSFLDDEERALDHDEKGQKDSIYA